MNRSKTVQSYGRTTEYREILKMASVEGEDFTVQIVSKLVEVDEEDLIDELINLGSQSRLIAEKGPQNVDNLILDFYRFTHRFFREYAYKSLKSDTKRRRLHRIVGECLENLQADKRPIAGQLAFHYREAHEHQKAIQYALLAAQNAHQNFKWFEAVEQSKQVLEIIEDSRKKDSYLSNYAEALLIWEDSAEYFTEIEDLYERLNEFILLIQDKPDFKHIYARLLYALASICYLKNLSNGERYAYLAIQYFQEVGDKKGEYKARRRLADILVDNENRFEEGIKLSRELIKFAEQCQDIDKFIYSYTSLAWSLLYIGKFDEAVEYAEKAYELIAPQCSKDVIIYGFVLRVLGKSYFKCGNYDKAIIFQQKAITTYHQIGDILEENWTRFELGESYVALNRIEEARTEYMACLQYAKKVEDCQFQEWLNSGLAGLEMLEGNLSKAEEHLIEAQKFLSMYQNLENKIDYKITLAHLRLLQNHEVETEQLLEDAQKLIAEFESKTGLVRIYNLYVQLSLNRREFEQAKQWGQKNIELCQKLGMNLELSGAYEQLGDLYSSFGDKATAKPLYQSALDIRKNLGNLQKTEEILHKINPKVE